MKKALIILILLSMSSILVASAQGSLRPRGDVNCDWEVTLADVNNLMDAILTDKPYEKCYPTILTHSMLFPLCSDSFRKKQDRDYVQ